MRDMRTLPIALLALLLAPGCFVSRSTRNPPLAPGVLKTLPRGTDAQQVLDALGAPSQVVQLGLRSAWLYEHVNEKRAGFTVIVVTLLNEDMRSDRLWLFFDEAGKLAHAGGSYEGGDAQWAMPWQDLDGD
jgi:outer membrane protein assembly factor BamE (lipoprotein component of BamABCDE complex)